jgi:hypothetical protein
MTPRPMRSPQYGSFSADAVAEMMMLPAIRDDERMLTLQSTNFAA